MKTSEETWNNIANNGGVGFPFNNFVHLEKSGADSGARLASTSGANVFNSNAWGSATQDHVMMEC